MPFLQQAEGVIVNGSTFVDIKNGAPDTRKREGIRLLLHSFVQREAMHDSGARGALGCHPGTRKEYIRNITSWGNGDWESEKWAFLMTGPAGAGKSAIAQTCARKIEAAGNLGASFFFYRPSGWNDPKRFIPTIVYQLTTRYSAYRDCIDTIILDDSLVLEKAMDVQFRELLVKPLQKLSVNGQGIGKGVVIVVDGLDECRGVEAQVQIIQLIATSIREQTTPFLWAFFSRPEPPITSAFSSEIAASISWKLPLTLSGNSQSDIEAYLRGSFQVIRAKHSIPTNVIWPTEADIRRLVTQSAGLFVYSVTAILYIGGLRNGRSGIEERLRVVLQLDSKPTDNPFSALDQLYMLVMMQVPEGVLFDTLSLLRLHQSDVYQIHERALGVFQGHCKRRSKVVSCYSALRLSPAAFHVAISNLYSVLQVKKSRSGEPEDLQFYHRSFLDFLLDPERSEQFFIKSPGVHQHCFEMFIRTMGNLVDTDVNNEDTVASFTVQAFFTLIEEHDGELAQNILEHLSQVNWKCWHHPRPNCYKVDFRPFIQKIPGGWRLKIVRPSRDGLFGALMQIRALLVPEQYEAEAYILGSGYKEGVIVKTFHRDRETFYEFQQPTAP